ncbi:HupE/UreJ family protein [Aureibaculum sp. 2210JD6-5]|uniref:HupE/UreJ family protein n=1 Tax=Aureibaculum sp. 2210JD6-5 TaxID=3103957 RepID=UPI002AACA8D1|nr:HupE/UreJ family protein [Aureibaculum sp. 2210JD6-5]MDY7394749.1 HupE/UreJ family protein [Aureibaculum sp. 2210JD6-5]
MEDFILYLKLGLYHVLDWQAYDHILFLIALVVIYNFSNWKKVIWLVTLFTIAHTLTLALAAYKVINVNISIVEFLIPLTIFITAAVNIFTVKKSKQKNSNVNLFFALFFGLIHGLGFSNYFRMLMDDSEAKLLPLLEFAIGIEIAQVIIVITLLVLGYIAQTFFRISKRDWVLVLSSIVIGVVIPMLFDRIFW